MIKDAIHRNLHIKVQNSGYKKDKSVVYAVMLVILWQTFARIKRLAVRFPGFSCQHAMHVVIAQPLYNIEKESLFLSHFLT